MRIQQEEQFVPEGGYIYRVTHRIMEGDCGCDHGPLWAAVTSMYVDKYPVTNDMYAVFLTNSGYSPEDRTNFLRHWRDGAPLPEDSDKPVTWVSPRDAAAYASFYGKSLPTDIEWQYFASGPSRFLWPWGDEYDPARLNGNPHGELTPVDAFPAGANEYGLLDLAGNAWEMTGTGEDGMHRFLLLRGGSYYRAPDFWHALGGPCPNNAHLKCPLLNEGLNRNGNVGFRCVRRVEHE